MSTEIRALPQLAAILNALPGPVDVINLLAQVLDTLPIGAALYDAADDRFRVLYHNEIYRQFADAGSRPILGRSLLEVFPSADSGGVAAMHEARLTGTALHYRDYVSSTERTWNWDIYPVRDAKGNVTKLLGTAQEMTQQVRTRARLEEAHNLGVEALLEVSRHVEASADLPTFFGKLTATIARLVHAEKVMFSVYDGERVTLQREPFGFPPEAVARMAELSTPVDPNGDGPAERLLFKDFVFRAALRADDPEMAPYQEGLKAMQVRSSLSMAWRAGDELLGVIGAYDSNRPSGFTEEDAWVLRLAAQAAGLVWQRRRADDRLAQLQKHETDQLRDYAERMASLERAKSQFLNLASHELRGPLAVLRGYASMIEDGSFGPLSPELARVAPTLIAKINQMNLLIQQMLDAARLEDSRLQLDRKPCDLAALTRSAVEAMQPLAGAGRTITVQEDGHPPAVAGDAVRLEMILTNLIDNAIKYSPEGSPVTCTVTTHEETARVSIRDQGVGIAPADLPKLFQRFSRVSTMETAHVPGTGLGLYLARELARMHGGDISVASQPGHGSEFSLTLPTQA